MASPILAIRATEDETVAEEDIAAWSALTTSGHTTALIAAGHNLLRDRPAELADALRHALS
ncbi:hypothetical protein ACPEIC_39520 [Stenotrophomonas sp. NPDC087984]|uniref:hypothetical protein n=1 Tax=Streptomyces violaceusniger TaxID=68280 RepID=UPI0009988557|nr:hypothetical protein [Streptomyces hygroscopicus]AQW56419.1 putative thioesterase [Streptomyces hygroscopicus]